MNKPPLNSKSGTIKNWKWWNDNSPNLKYPSAEIPDIPPCHRNTRCAWRLKKTLPHNFHIQDVDTICTWDLRKCSFELSTDSTAFLQLHLISCSWNSWWRHRIWWRHRPKAILSECIGFGAEIASAEPTFLWAVRIMLLVAVKFVMKTSVYFDRIFAARNVNTCGALQTYL